MVEDADEAVEGMGLPESGAGEVGFCAIVGTLALDFRLEPNPKPLKREFRALIWAGGKKRAGEKKEGMGY